MGKTIIGLMGPDKHEQHIQLSFDLGKMIAEQGWLLLTGGRNRGVMDAACKGAKSAGGTTIGILPTCDPADVSEAVDIAIYTDMGSARDNINVLTSSVVIAVGMGPGTAAEVALALKAQKPVVLVHADDEAKKFFQSLAPAHVHISDSVETTLTLVKAVLASQS